MSSSWENVTSTENDNRSYNSESDIEVIHVVNRILLVIYMGREGVSKPDCFASSSIAWAAHVRSRISIMLKCGEWLIPPDL